MIVQIDKANMKRLADMIGLADAIAYSDRGRIFSKSQPQWTGQRCERLPAEVVAFALALGIEMNIVTERYEDEEG